MASPDIENDNMINPGEVTTGPEDCQVVLYYKDVRFIVIILQPENCGDDDIVGGIIRRIDEAQDDPDEMTYHRCLEDVTQLAIEGCKRIIHELVTSSAKPKKKKQHRLLDDYLHPMTFYLRLVTVDGNLQAMKLNNVNDYASTYEPTPIPLGECLPRSVINKLRKRHELIPVSALVFVEELYMGDVVKVAHNRKTCVFKSANYGTKGQLKREIYTLERIRERWRPDDPNRPRVPLLLGLVSSISSSCFSSLSADNEIVEGLLEDFIDGDRLSELLNPFDEEEPLPSVEERQRWKTQIHDTVSLLHHNGLVWGDVKDSNVLIERKSRDAWLIDFGGEFTDGWVDEHLKETVEGDRQGLQRLGQRLDCPSNESQLEKTR